LEEARRAFLRDLLPYNAILAAALIAAGWAQLFIGLRPLATIGERVAAVRSGKQNRMGEDFPKEVAPLVAEVDALIAAREDELDRARRRAADLAHGFKTPLQALLGEADRLRESGQDGAARSIEEIAAAMSRHVDRELTRTRLAGRSRAAKTRVGPVIERVVSVVSRTPQGAELSWQIDANGAPLAAIDAGDLTEALGAIVENASRHAKSHVTIRARDLGAQVEITVEDDGPGIEPSRIDEMRKRGARADQGGHGLGLSISAEIAEAVGGALELENIAPGLRVRLLLPAVLG
ncbi:MAG: HAMP domain-containing histidine kinase, partial [Sphingomonadales bacterium]|nr:HAMP domain-containing histidine kinase [Sphingomonadales bacterium]